MSQDGNWAFCFESSNYNNAARRKTRTEGRKKVENEHVNEHEHPISKKKREKKTRRRRKKDEGDRSVACDPPPSSNPLRFYGSESVRVDVLLIAGAECANFRIQECRRRNLTDFRLQLVINAAFPQRTPADGEREASRRRVESQRKLKTKEEEQTWLLEERGRKRK